MATSSLAALQSGNQSDLKISRLNVHKLKLPYKTPVKFSRVVEDAGEYVLLRIGADNGKEGIAESVCRPQHTGEDATLVAYQLKTFFEPLLLGHDPFDQLALVAGLNSVRACEAAKAMIDVALWDLRGKLLQQPVWRLLGASKPQAVPLSWIAHGNTIQGQIDEAKKMMETRGYRGMKLKTWRKTMDDVVMVEGVRKAVGDAMFICVDGNSHYDETEARTIFPKMTPYNVSFVEDPCDFNDPRRAAALASVLPIAVLGDESCRNLSGVATHVSMQAVGAVSVKLRRTGFTDSLKIIAHCEVAGLPVVIGTDSESRLAAMPRMHLRTAVPHLAPWPTETHFFDKLKDDVFAGDFQFKDGTITPSDAPGFGAGIDMTKLERYSI
jgi:L-alanine-DL-glutamate epimerase-like enolase superfamily enzyme